MIHKILNELKIKNSKLALHCERVACMCYAFGKELSLSNDVCGQLYDVGLYHDIGKMYLVEGINDDKVEFIYPFLSYAIFSLTAAKTERDTEIAQYILQHNENFDGTGYPFNLKKHDIHLISSIVHLADAYDTIRMNDNTHEQTTVEIRKNAGTKFPKKMITPFFKMLINNEDLQFDYTSEDNIYGEAVEEN